MHHGMPGTMAPTEHRPPAGAGINDNTTPGNPSGRFG
jgi:hypothetical protein